MHRHKERTGALLQQLAAEYLEEKNSGLAMLTVFEAVLSRDGRLATIYVSVFPPEREGEAKKFVDRERSDFREHIKSHSRMRVIPRINFRVGKSMA